MKKLWIFLIAILILGSVWYAYNSRFSKEPSLIVETKKETPRTSPVALTEETLSVFAGATIEKKCPFYEPNGAAYRSCLSSWIETLEANLLVEQIDEVGTFCLSFVQNISDENSIEGAELFLKCKIYTLSE